MSIQNTKCVKNIQNNIHNNKKIKSWLLKYNDLNNTNEFLFEEAEKLLIDLLLIDINFKNLIEFEIIDNIIQIKTIDTCDEIMLEALNIYKKEKNKINIGTAGGMTRLSTGYTFLNIQEHCKFIRENIENISTTSIFQIGKKYQFLDDIFLRVLNKHPEKMSGIFFNMFKTSPKTVIKFLSNKSNILEDLSIILKMPKWIFIKALFY